MASSAVHPQTLNNIGECHHVINAGSAGNGQMSGPMPDQPETSRWPDQFRISRKRSDDRTDSGSAGNGQMSGPMPDLENMTNHQQVPSGHSALTPPPQLPSSPW